jgi:DDE superfamily endonuclease
MHKLVQKQKEEGISITSATIAAELRARLDVSVDRSTVRRWLRALGYRWRHKRYVGGMKPQAKRARIRQFILEYAAALSEEEIGTAIIVYVDESYIHAHHASKKGWFHPSNRDVIGDDNGTRLIILHAMTDSGLLDYHNTMTGVKFVAWLRNRLLPTFEKLHPGKKMVLVLDNASYHKPRDETWISSSKAKNKHELVHAGSRH